MKELTLGHYAPKMYESWLKFERDIERKYRNEPKGDAYKAMAVSIVMVKEMMERAVHWSISDTAFPLVWNTDIIDTDYEGCRPPYPCMAIEYNFNYAVVAGSQELGEQWQSRLLEPALKRIIFLMDLPEHEKIAILSAYQPTWTPEELSEIQQGGGFAMPDWNVAPLSVVLSYEAMDDQSLWLTRGPDGAHELKFGAHAEVKPSLPMYDEAVDTKNTDQFKALVRDMADELRVTLGLLGILSCSNAPIERVPAPAKLNKKREKSGRPTIPQYRTLHVSDHTTRGGKPVGTHASPRAHWRRGHIRNQKTARGYIRKWIKPTIVNPDGGTPSKPEVVLT